MIGAAYAVAAACCFFAWRGNQPRQQPSQRERGSLVWMVTAMLFGAMALARSTDAAAMGADAARRLTAATPWYDNRRPIQFTALIALVVIWAFATTLMVRQSRRNPPSPLVVMVAMVLASLLVLDAIRAVSLHATDSLLTRSTLFTVEVGDLLELAFLASIVAMSVRSLTAPAMRTRPSWSGSRPTTDPTSLPGPGYE